MAHQAAFQPAKIYSTYDHLTSAQVAEHQICANGTSNRPEYADSLFSVFDRYVIPVDGERRREYSITRFLKRDVFPPEGQEVEWPLEKVALLFVRRNGRSDLPDLRGYHFEVGPLIDHGTGIEFYKIKMIKDPAPNANANAAAASAPNAAASANPAKK